MEFRDGPIEGVVLRPIQRFNDSRGWLCELFRHDDISEAVYPVMAYLSMTASGVARGPHEHVDQTDYFCFIGPSTFEIHLWDYRPTSPTYLNRIVELAGVDRPMVVIVPPGVVHAYRNVGKEPGLVFNGPNRLFKGWNRKELVDEIRHEANPNSPFVMESRTEAA